MVYHDDDDKEKEDGVLSDEALGDVLEKDEDEDEIEPDGLLDDEKAWE